MSLQSIYGGFLQALDVSDERMEEIVDALTSQIAENNRARREIIEENVGNPEGRRSIRRSFSPSTPSAQREAVSYFLDETELAVFDSFQEERQQRQMSRTGFSVARSRAGTVMFNESVTTGPDGQIGTNQNWLFPTIRRRTDQFLSNSAADRILHDRTPLPR